VTESRPDDTAETAAAEPTPTPAPPAAPAPEPAASIAPEVPPPALPGVTEPVGAPPTLTERHPEVLVGAAFVGGILLANLIRRRGD
jgi:hypothetical protein